MKKIITIMALTILLAPASALAGTNLNVNMNVEIPQMLNVDWSVSGASVQLTGANAITAAEFIQGFKDGINGGTMICDANMPYDITVQASAATFTGGSGSKPTQDIRIDVDGAGVYSNMVNGTTAVTVINEQPAAQAELHDLTYRINFYSGDTPGIYNTNLTYTILID